MIHPSDDRIEGYARRTLGPADLLAVDDHVAACDACRKRAAALAMPSLTDLRSALLSPESHLSEAQVSELAAGVLGAEPKAAVEAHLSVCATCTREVGELRAWARRRRGTRQVAYAAAAAVLILLLIPAAARWRSLSGTDQAKQANLAGLEELPPEQQRRVRAALRAGVAEPPAHLADLGAAPDVLMGEAPGASFRLVEPLGCVTVADRPTFRWEPLTGAETYVVRVSDEALRTVAESPPLRRTDWTPAQALSRARVYLWEVTARRAMGSVTAPAPPEPIAKFKVLEEEDARLLDRVAREHPASHLLLGILYAHVGARVEAVGQLSQVLETDSHHETAKRTLERLDAVARRPPR